MLRNGTATDIQNPFLPRDGRSSQPDRPVATQSPFISLKNLQIAIVSLTSGKNIIVKVGENLPQLNVKPS